MNSTNVNKTLITVLRVAIGWHFLYEGLSKLSKGNWSSQSFLANSTGFMSGIYQWIGSSTELMNVVDLLNMYGLVFIGLALFLGMYIRYAAIAGTMLLSLYYFAYPPFGGALPGAHEGNLFIVNKNFIEAMVLIVLFLLKEKGYGLYAVKSGFWKKTIIGSIGQEKEKPLNSRREVLKNLSTLPALGIIGLGAFREKRKFSIDSLSGATVKVGAVNISDLKGELPKGKIGNHEISRMIAGGNLIAGWSHARDLIYVSSLFKAYNTDKKIFETLILAEQSGINTINISFESNGLLQKYKKITGSKIKVISQVAPDMKNNDYYVNINKSIDYGAEIVQIMGHTCDTMVRTNRIDVIDKMLGNIRSQGYTAGLASHAIDAMLACEDQGIIPDYYMKTMHHDQYWSAHPRENREPFEVDGKNNSDHNKFHNNIFCSFPDKTVEFVKRASVPVMGYKVLAAGAIEPEDGFKWAFENGADFICVGMFDFQVVGNVNTAIDTLNKLKNRKREWFA